MAFHNVLFEKLLVRLLRLLTSITMINCYYHFIVNTTDTSITILTTIFTDCPEPVFRAPRTENMCPIAVAVPRAPSHLNNRLLGNVTIGNIEPRTHYLGNWSPRPFFNSKAIEQTMKSYCCHSTPCIHSLPAVCVHDSCIPSFSQESSILTLTLIPTP